MKFKKNDIVISDMFPSIERQIVEPRKKSYLWKYTDSDEIYDSRNSNDPDLYYWKILDK